MLFLCKTRDTETAIVNTFLCVAPSRAEVEGYFTDDITKLEEVIEGFDIELKLRDSPYDGLALIAPV